MAVGVQKAWSVTASSNGNSDTNANWAEGMLAPSINNSARANMAAIKGWSNQISGGCTCAGSSNAYTITSDAAAAISTAYGAGMMFMLKANHTNTGAATLNVDSVGAVAIKTSDGGDVVAGDIVSGGLYLLAYNATGPRFDLIGTFAGGSFQPLDATLTAVAGLSFSTTNAFFRATDVDTFVAESASNFRSALGLGNLATVTPGTGVAAALAVNVGSAGAIVVNGGVLGTPSSGTLTNATGLPISSGVSGLGTNVATALGIAIGSAGAVVTSNSTDTLSNKTLSSPTLSGTVAGTVTFSGNSNFSGGSVTFFNLANSMPAAGSGGTMKFSNGDANYGILFAVSNANGTGYMQAQRTDGTGTVYALSLNPNGGDIIGNSTGPSSVYSLGYRGTPLNNQPNNYTFVLADAGSLVQHNSASAHAYTIPPNSSVAFPLGTVIPILNPNGGGALTVVEGSGVTLRRGDGVAGTGTRTITANGLAAIEKIGTNEWYCTGIFT